MKNSKYLVVVGTNRNFSVSAKVGEYYFYALKERGVDADILNLEHLPTTFIFENAYGKKLDAFAPFQEKVTRADKMLFVIPEYNGSFPGVLKAFIDACDFPDSFAGKKCSLVGLSAGQFGNLRGLEHFSGVANYIKMDVYHNKLYLPGVEKDLSDDGVINEPAIVNRIQKQIDGFIKF